MSRENQRDMASGGSTTEKKISKEKIDMLSASCEKLSLDPLSGNVDLLKHKAEVMKWVDFASAFPDEPEASLEKLNELNEDLTQKSVLLGDGLKPSKADVVVYSALHSFVSRLSNTDRQKFPNVMRWMDYIQNKEDFGEVFEKILVEKPDFVPHVPKAVEKLEVDPKSKQAAPDAKCTEKLEVGSSSKKTASEVKVSGESKVTEVKKKVPEKEQVMKDVEAVVSLLNIQVGLIRKAWKHPSADSLLVEEIDLGDGNLRQVVSGLAKYFSPEQLENRHVVLVTNVKPGKLRDVTSAGLVLCASNQDHTIVEPLLPPGGVKVGERVSFSGVEGKPEDVLNPKKKQLEKITPHLYTDDKGIATYKGIPFMTSSGPCTSSIPNASIK